MIQLKKLYLDDKPSEDFYAEVVRCGINAENLFEKDSIPTRVTTRKPTGVTALLCSVFDDSRLFMFVNEVYVSIDANNFKQSDAILFEDNGGKIYLRKLEKCIDRSVIVAIAETRYKEWAMLRYNEWRFFESCHIPRPEFHYKVGDARANRYTNWECYEGIIRKLGILDGDIYTKVELSLKVWLGCDSFDMANNMPDKRPCLKSKLGLK